MSKQGPIERILRRARNIIRTKGWCQKNHAVDKYGYAISENDESACKFCIHGAIMLAQTQLKFSDKYMISGFLHNLGNDKYNRVSGFCSWQDEKGRTKKEVLHELGAVASACVNCFNQ